MEKDVTVYTTTRCPYCKMVKNFLSQNNVPFKEVNVEKEPAMMQKLIQTTGQMGVPQTEINGKWIVGYDPQSIAEALQ